jgi:hypothetical protein
MAAPVSKCIICDDVLRNYLAKYCRRCANIMARVGTRGKAETAAQVAALRKAWDKEDECFRCYYSGIRLNDDNPRDPRYVTFDLTALEKGADLVVTAALIHEMKGNLSEEEFKEIVRQLAKHFIIGETVDEGVFKVEHYR